MRRDLPPPIIRSLSARLLVLTVFFVMLAEVLIYVPSIARFRQSHLNERLANAHIAALALEATPARAVSADLERQLLQHVMAHGVEIRLGERYTYMLGGRMPPQIDAEVDLRRATVTSLIFDAFATLAQTGNRVLRVTGHSPNEPAATVEVTMDEWPLRAAMIDFSGRILQLSIVISLITAALVYLALQWLMVRPLGRLTDSMTGFREDPRDLSRVMPPSRRRDEIGIAQRELASMQEGLRRALHQRARLAALGEAVTHINHDLRNILASAQLVTDRLETSADPEVRRTAPTLLKAIDRAIDLCSSVLGYARADMPELRPEAFPLRDLVDEVGAAVVPAARPAADGGAAVWVDAVSTDLIAVADRAQLFRVLVNLGLNAVQAGARRVEVDASAVDDTLVVTVADDGPGLPARARERLFQPFAGSARSDGSGLGLAIARELMRAHGGDILLDRTGPDGTVFRLTLPRRQTT